MPEQTAPPPAAPAAKAGPGDLRLVLFGMPAAGKSSLLGALSRAAEAQEHLLGGKLIDETHGLADLRQQLYDTTPRRTPEEVVPYPVRYEPLPANGQTKPSRPVEAVFMDCDGRVANDLLVRRKELDENSPEGTLAHEVLEADTLILVIDASAPPAQVEADFGEFLRFVRTFERSRKERVEVAGLPVFLVLTKCDLLARPGDSPADWMDRIEQRKAEVDAHFREFMARESEESPSPPNPLSHTGERGSKNGSASVSGSPPLPSVGEGGRGGGEGEDDSPFGGIELHVWATAVKRPQLAGSPAKPREPYGVAELFRQCLTEAAIYRARTRRADRRMWVLVSGLGGLLAVMAALTGWLWLSSQSGHLSLLASRVEDYRLYTPTKPAERLAGTPTELRQKLARLEEIRDDPQFSRLKPEQQTFIEGRIDELKSYVDYYEKILKEKAIVNEQSEEALEQRVQRLETELAPPRPEWEPTRAGETHKALLDSAAALRKAVARARNWYLDSGGSAADLWAFAGHDPSGIDFADWTARVQKLIDPSRRPPFNEADPLPGDPVLTYATAFRFDRVREARAAWETDRARLRKLLDVLSALGLAQPPSKQRPAVLVFPADFTLEQAKDRLVQLKEHYPDYETTFTRATLPDEIRPKVRQVAGNQYRTLLKSGRREVLRQLGGKGTEETPAKWEAVRKWLKSPDELASWRVLARVLQRLDDAPPDDPVEELAKFLAKEDFTIAPNVLELVVPEARTTIVPSESGRLVISHRSLGKSSMGKSSSLKFEQSGEPERDQKRRVWVYKYRLLEGRSLTFKPGDKLWAELPLRGGKELLLMWVDSRSASYEIERLRATPRLLRPGQKAEEGRLAEGVQLIPKPDASVPRVPDLIPDVRGE